MSKTRDEFQENNTLPELNHIHYKLTSPHVIESIWIKNNPDPWLKQLFIKYNSNQDEYLSIFFTNYHFGLIFNTFNPSWKFGDPPSSSNIIHADMTHKTILCLPKYIDYLFAHGFMDNNDRINIIQMINVLFHLEKRDENLRYHDLLSQHPFRKALDNGDKEALIKTILPYRGFRSGKEKTTNNALVSLVPRICNMKNKHKLERKIYIDTIEYLLNHGADVNKFHRCNDVEVLKIFLSRGADINYREVGTGYTLMHYAFCNPEVNVDFIKFILQNGASLSLDIGDDDGLTPLDHLMTCKGALDPSQEIQISNNIPKIYAILITYLINKNEFEKMIEITVNCPPRMGKDLHIGDCLSLIECKDIYDTSSKKFIVMFNQRLYVSPIFSNPDWILFANRITNRIYPNVLKIIDKITSDENFDLVKTALLYAKDFGIAETLNTLIQMYEEDILNDSIALRLNVLSKKMQIYYDNYEYMNIQLKNVPQSTEKEIFALAESLHRALLSAGELSTYREKCIIYGRNNVMAKYGLFSETNSNINIKLQKIKTSNDWTTLSPCAFLNLRGDTKACMDIAQTNHSFRK